MPKENSNTDDGFYKYKSEQINRFIKESIDYDKAFEERDFGLDVLDQAEKRITIKPYITYDPKTNEIKTCHPELAELVRLVTNGDPRLLQALTTSKEGIRKAILRDQGAWLRLLLLAKNIDILQNAEKPDHIIKVTGAILSIMKSLPDGGPAKKLPNHEDSRTLQERAASKAGRQLLDVETESETLPGSKEA
jgi:hypothetical protein